LDSLNELLRKFVRETALLESLIDTQAGAQWSGLWGSPVVASVRSFSVIRLHDAWARFCRGLVLTSAAGDVFTGGGAKLHRSKIVPNNVTPIDFLISTYTHRRREPDWWDVAAATAAANKLGVANYSTISAGLTLSNIGFALSDIRLCRNYFAHRSKRTNDALNSLRARERLPTTTRPEEIPLLLVPGGATLFRTWCWELKQRAVYSVK
jgi:hypothetical protein